MERPKINWPARGKKNGAGRTLTLHRLRLKLEGKALDRVDHHRPIFLLPTPISIKLVHGGWYRVGVRRRRSLRGVRDVASDTTHW